MRKLSCTLLLLALAAQATDAQIARPGRPASLDAELAGAVPTEVLPSPDIARMKAEDAERGPFPFRYGAVIPAAYSIEQHGRWDLLDDGRVVWRLELASPGAYTIGLLFDRFELPEGSEIYVYNADRSHVVGAFTREVRQSNGMLTVQPVRGDRITIEYVQDPWVSEIPSLRVGQVIHDYRDVLDRMDRLDEGLDGQAACLIDINCPEGAPYQNIKRSVVEVISGGSLCSASILNNTAEDGTPYLLTAEHCGDQTNVVAIFNYERTGCGGGTSSTADTVSGATLRAKSNLYDSQLYLLDSAPPLSYEPFFAGWARGIRPQGPAVGIHHASGLPKKLSIDSSGPANSGNQWAVQWDQGIVQGGSSGSPLFNDRLRVIGPACCVTNFSCGNQTTFYGRFDRFWKLKGLDQWLDPLGKERAGLDGYDPVFPQAIPYYGSNGNPRRYSSSLPAIGGTWTATVNTNSVAGATGATIVGHAEFANGQFFAFGELLVDTSSPLVFSLTASSVGGIASFSANIPNDSSLKGRVVHTQAFILGGALTATNGIKLRAN